MFHIKGGIKKSSLKHKTFCFQLVHPLPELSLSMIRKMDSKLVLFLYRTSTTVTSSWNENNTISQEIATQDKNAITNEVWSVRVCK